MLPVRPPGVTILPALTEQNLAIANGDIPPPPPVEGMDSVEDADDAATPGTRRALEGSGGGGMSCESVKTFGSVDEGPRDDEADGEDRRWALFSAGNAGGVSLLSEPPSSSSPSS